MGMNLAGLIAPVTEHRYVWWFDDAVDPSRSDWSVWARGNGTEGLEFLEGRKPAVYRWAPLEAHVRRTCALAGTVGRPAEIGPVPLVADEWDRMAEAVRIYEIVAYGLVGVDGDIGVSFERELGLAGLRVSKDLMRAIGEVKGTFEKLVPCHDDDPPDLEGTVEKDGKRYRVVALRASMLGDLAARIWRASRASESEKKV